MKKICSIYQSPIGTFTIANDGKSLTDIRYGNHTCDYEYYQHDEFNHRVISQLEEYFSGTRQVFDIPILLEGTKFQMQVWNSILKTPYAETIHYSDIADDINKPSSIRAVGMATAKNPILIVVPSHRVINSNGSLAGYSGGSENKDYLLKLEKNTLKRLSKKLDDNSIPFGELLSKAFDKTNMYSLVYYPNEHRIMFPDRTRKKFLCEKEMTNLPDLFFAKNVYYEDLEKYHKLISDMKLGVPFNRLEFRLKENPKVWYQISLTVVETDEENRPEVIFGTFKDITKEKTEQLNRERIFKLNRDFFNSLQNIFFGVHRLNLDTGELFAFKITMPNGEGKLLTNSEPIDFESVVKKMVKIYHPNDRERFCNQFSLENIRKLKSSNAHCIEETYRLQNSEAVQRVSNIIIVNNKYFEDNMAIILQTDVSDDYQKSNIVNALGSEYFALYLIDIDANTMETLRSDMVVKDILNLKIINNYTNTMKSYVEKFIHEKDIPKVMEFIDIENLRRLLNDNRREISINYKKRVHNHYEIIQMKYILSTYEKNSKNVLLALKNLSNNLSEL